MLTVGEVLARIAPRLRAQGVGVILAVALPLCTMGTPASAQAASTTTFGPSLAQAPDVSFGCEEQPFEPPELTHASSCTWTTAAAAKEGEALQPPEGKGTITQVSVRVGPHTGPMKVVIMRVLLEWEAIGTAEVHASISCCSDVAESAVFTPTANAVTPVSVDLPVEVEGQITPGLKIDDLVGLSILEAGVPIPALDEKSLNILEEPSDYDEFPAMQPGVAQLAGDPRGYQLLMDATWTPPSASTPTSTPTTPATPAPAKQTAQPIPTISFPTSGLARVKGKDALVKLSCGQAAACDGTVRLQSAPAAGAAGARVAKKSKKKAKVVTYASGGFAIAAGKSQSVNAKLSGEGSKLARGHARRKVWVNVTLSGASGKSYSRSVTISF